MQNPFFYGEEVSGPYFTDRKRETEDLVRDLSRGQNVILHSPRRYGKTSLIKHALSILADQGLLTFYVNLYAATSKRKFIEVYARAIASGTQGKMDQVLGWLKEFLPRMIPKVVIREEGSPEFEFDYNKTTKDFSPFLEDLYEAVEKYAKKKNKRAVVVFDEFQEILNLEDDEIERSMRGIILSHKNTAYVFMGSQRHLMQKLFNNPERPFYKSGRMFPLGKIGREEFGSFIQTKFEEGKITVGEQEINSILMVSECHPYYTQMLCSVLWDRNLKKAGITDQSLQQAIAELISRESYTYTTIWDSLSSKRKRVLEALAQVETEGIYSQEFVIRFDLLNPSFVQKSLRYLEGKGILYKEEKKVLFSDMFFKQWILKKIV